MANNNYRVESTKFFNSQTGKDDRAWAKAAAAYFRQLGSSNKTNFVDAMAEYYAKLNAGTISVPVSPTATQALVSNGGTVTAANSANNKTVSATYVISGGAVQRVSLPATAAIVTSAQALTGVAPTGTYTNTVTFTVAGGVITAIALS